LFQIATTLSMFGAHAQKVSVTGPVSGAGFGAAVFPPDELQPAASTAPRIAAVTVLTRDVLRRMGGTSGYAIRR
jgi:hypothetical protein